MTVRIDNNVHAQIEDFHFAYEILIVEETGEEVAYVVDACHSYLY